LGSTKDKTESRELEAGEYGLSLPSEEMGEFNNDLEEHIRAEA